MEYNKKTLSSFILGFLAIWVLNVLFIYLVKGELRIMDKLLGSITMSFGLTFGEFIFENRNNDSEKL